MDEARHLLISDQKIVFHNTSQNALTAIPLLNWVEAYKKRGTLLYRQKLEDRNSDLHFASSEELGGMTDLWVRTDENKEFRPLSSAENIELPLENPLQPGDKITVYLKYTLKIPSAKFTGYGYEENSWNLKYFFPVPDSFSGRTLSAKNFLDADETENAGTYWDIKFTLPSQWKAAGNLEQPATGHFTGTLNSDPEIQLSTTSISKLETSVDGNPVTVSFGYKISNEEKPFLEFYLPLHLQFVHQKTGLLPRYLFISEKFRKKEDFAGNLDIKFWNFRWKMFSDAQDTDLNYFGLIAKKVLQQEIKVYNEEDHWFVNGIKSYLENTYLEKFYHDTKLLGNLPETEIFGMKPLKLFYAAKIPLTDRYDLGYRYMMTQNLDQKISTPYSRLSNFNRMAVSGFETGNLFSHIAEYTGTANFENFLKSYIAENKNDFSGQDFLNATEEATTGKSKFLAQYLQHKQRVNFKLKRFRTEDDANTEIEVRKNSPLPVPFKAETIATTTSVSKWLETPAQETNELYRIATAPGEKIVLNGSHYFPESSYRDNYLYTKGLFSNMKKVRLKFFSDISNPEYSEIYLNPRFTFNAYDKVLIGLNLRNYGFLKQKFTYSLTPYFSTGTGKFTGSGSVAYSFMPPEAFFRELSLGISGSYFHYDYDLSYRRLSGSATLFFAKEPRSTISRSAGLSYNHYRKDLNEEMIAKNEYGEYNLWSANYSYSDRRLIHEKFGGIGLQGMHDFTKISAEAFYRYEFARNKKLSIRLFGGYFLQNNTRNDMFDFGIARVSNYAFSHGLLGQSASSGILSQQFILADGGFKSFVGTTANQWITSMNADTQVWKLFGIYGDAGVYKNRNKEAQFIWDTGVKLRLIPDFLEIYAPVYSTLGFEPAKKDYLQRIRFTLVFNLGAVANTLRRGWY